MTRLFRKYCHSVFFTSPSNSKLCKRCSPSRVLGSYFTYLHHLPCILQYFTI
ncbi:unnamed protein product, partial [Brassica rapa subsp. trilocularis]